MRPTATVEGGAAIEGSAAVGTADPIGATEALGAAYVDPNLAVLLFLLAGSLLYTLVLAADALDRYGNPPSDDRGESPSGES